MPRRTFLVETDCRVFEVTYRRGRRTGPGRYRWRLTAEILSGPDLSEAEAADLLQRLVAELVSRGHDVSWWAAF